MKKYALWKKAAARMLVLALIAGLAFPGTAFAATAQDYEDADTFSEQSLEDFGEVPGEDGTVDPAAASLDISGDELQESSGENAPEGNDTSLEGAAEASSGDPADTVDENEEETVFQEEEDENLTEDESAPGEIEEENPESEEDLTSEEQPESEEDLTSEEQPESEADLTSEEQPESEVEPASEEQPESETEPASEEQPESEAEPASEEQPESEAEPASEEQPESEAEPASEEQPESEAEPVSEEQPSDENAQQVDDEDIAEDAVEEAPVSAVDTVGNEEGSDETVEADSMEAVEGADTAETSVVPEAVMPEDETVETPAAGADEQVNRISSLSFNEDHKYSMALGVSGFTTRTLNVSVEYDTSEAYDTNQSYYFRSNDTSILTVSQKGVVKAVGVGSTYIELYTKEDGYEYTWDRCYFTTYATLYRVALSVNGGKWESSYYKGGIFAEKNDKVYLPDSFSITRNGYQLAGWTEVKDASTGIYKSSYKVTKNITLYAKWKRLYKVTLNAGSGYFGTDKTAHKMVVEVPVGTDVGSSDLSYLSDPHKGTYVFVGWYKDSKLTKPVKKSDVITKNVTYYAKWQAKTYKITVTNLKGSSYYNRASNSYVRDSTANTYSFYIRAGESIGNIYANKNDTEAVFYFDKACKAKPYYYDYVPTGNTGVYAKWYSEVTIKWDANGGQTKYNNEKTGTVQSKKQLMCEDLPDDLVRKGYYFVGWYDTADTSKLLKPSHVFDKSTTVKAKWAKGITVTFKANGGKMSGNSVIYTKPKALIQGRPPYVTHDGYIFMGWKSSTTQKIVKNIAYEKPAKSTTYTAVWKKITSTVTVTLQAGSGSIYDWDKDKYVTKKVVKVPKNATMDSTVIWENIWENTPNHDESFKNLIVTGWSTTKNGKKLSASYRFTKNITLYPVWGKNTYLYTAMVTNGGSIDKQVYNRPYVVSSSKGSTISLPTKAMIEREGYTFVGWYLDAAFKKKITNTTKFKVTANRYIYARWKKN